MPSAAWAELAQKKREALGSLIPDDWRIHSVPSPVDCPSVLDWVRGSLTPEEVDITEAEPLNLLANIHAQVWSSEEVVRAFCHRAAVVHQLTNCLAEIMFVEAIATAQSLDQHFRQHRTICGPLHGLPISFMDRYRIAGYETSAGFVAWLGPKETQHTEALIVRHMKGLGAVPFCKTNCPQSMLIAATDNNVIGPTLNPFCRSLSAGGAAGGEGALQAMRGSPAGWVTEIAGSARIPAVFNGLFALRVCHGRLPTAGVASGTRGMPEYAFTPALISWDLPLLQYISRLTLGSPIYQEDLHYLELPWRESKYMRLDRIRPRFAIMHDDHHAHPQPPVRRALNLVHAALKEQCFDVVAWDPPEHAAAVETHFRLLGADGGSTIRSLIDKTGEPPVKGLQKWYQEPEAIGRLSAEQLWSWSEERAEYVQSYCKYWEEMNQKDPSRTRIEGVIMPVSANAAAYEHGLSYFGYSAIVNYLDFAATSFPVTMVDEYIDVRQFDQTMASADDSKVNADYDPRVFHGHPVGLQVMCRRLEEETCLKLAKIITEALHQHKLRSGHFRGS